MNWIEGEHYYYDQKGRVVLTEKYHLIRGYCCSNGCRHCPYDYVNVSEPEKSRLLHERKKQKEK